MLVSSDQIASCVRNALGTRVDTCGRLRMLRFAPEQIADYASDGEQFPVRCRANANITLDFVTDAEWFGFEYDVQQASSRNFYGMDLYADGVLIASRFTEDFKTNAVLFDLPGGKHRVTVFLPWSAEIMIRNMALSAGARFQRASPASKRILALGDSITQGYIAVHPGGTWAGILTRELGAEILNQGVGAYGFLSGSLKHPAAWEPDLILVAYGTNDYGREETASGFRRCVLSYMDRLSEVFPEKPVLMIPPVYRGDEKNRYRERSRTYTLEDAREIIREIAVRHPGAASADMDEFPHGAEWFSPDYLHPNDAGFAAYAKLLLPQVKRLL